MAVRGERWCAARQLISGHGGRRAPPWEIVGCELMRVDDQGRGLWAEVHDDLEQQFTDARLRELAS